MMISMKLTFALARVSDGRNDGRIYGRIFDRISKVQLHGSAHYVIKPVWLTKLGVGQGTSLL